MTSLLIAAWEGHTEIVKILLDHGANVSTKTNNRAKGKNTYIRAYTYN